MINFLIFMFFSLLAMIFFLLASASLKEDKDILFAISFCVLFSLAIINEFSLIYFLSYKKVDIENRQISIIELEDKYKNCYLERDKLVYIYKNQTPVKKIYSYKAWPFFLEKEEIVLTDRYLYLEKQEIFSLSKIMNENVTQSFFHRISKYDLFAY